MASRASSTKVTIRYSPKTSQTSKPKTSSDYVTCKSCGGTGMQRKSSYKTKR